MDKFKVLVIDDEKIIRERLKNLLELDGYEAFTAADGKEGIDLFHREHPEIALVDVKMPGMDGIEVLKKIKGETKETEVIIITGHGEIDTAIQALREGAFAYIAKPIEYDGLEIDIKKALEKLAMQKKLEDYVHNLEVAHRQLKEQQAQILQAAKLTAVGQLGSGVAHEINQPLMAIASHLEILLMNAEISARPEINTKMLKIKDQFVRLGTIIKRLTDYSSGRIGAYETMDINQPIQDAYYLFAQLLKDYNIAVTLGLEQGLPQLRIDRYQVQDVVINFLLNARDAVEETFNQKEGGSISIVSKLLKEENVILVGVIDNGTPITADIKENIFVPFFTTKPPGKGTGLGLSVCYTIIKDHCGLINFTGLSGGRKIFYFLIPIDKDADLLDKQQAIEKRIADLFNHS